MARLADQVARRGQFHGAAQIHHHDAVRDMFDHAQIMGDENHRQAHLFLQIGQQVHHLRPDRHIQRRHWLITDHQLGFQDQRPGDADALTLPAGKFMGIAVQLVGQQADPLHDIAHPGAHHVGGGVGLMGHQRLGDDLATVMRGLSAAIGS